MNAKKKIIAGAVAYFGAKKNCLPIPCHWRDRSDGKAVEFLEVEDFDGSKKYEPGDNVRSCEGCALLCYSDCFYIPCIPSERTDENHVKFIRL